MTLSMGYYLLTSVKDTCHVRSSSALDLSDVLTHSCYGDATGGGGGGGGGGRLMHKTMYPCY